MTDQTIKPQYDEWRIVKETDIAHLAGVIDAIGNIRVSVIKDSDYRIDYDLRPMVQLTRPNKEDPLLGKLMQYSDEVEAKYSIIEKQHDTGDGVSIEWKVEGSENIEAVLDPLLDYMVSKFHPTVLMLTEILPALEDGEHRTKEGFYEIIGMNDELREHKSDHGNVKYTQEYFAEEWEDDLTVVK